jgi:hypothetical protein
VRRSRPLRVVLALAVASVTGLVACNAILGNEERELDGNVLGSKPDASNKPDVTVGPSSDAGVACDADITRDPRNCGACGHDCLQGDCATGQCQPFVLASGQAGPGNLATEDGGLYWTNSDGTVHGCEAASCMATAKVLTTVTAGNPLLSGLAVQDAQLYFTAYYTDSLYSCPVTGCASPQKIAGNVPQPYSVATDAQNAYFVSASQAYLVRCALPSCAGGPVRVAGDGKPAWYGTVIDDTNAYWYGGGPTQQFDKAIIYRAPKAAVDGGAEVLLSNRTIQPGPSRRNLAVKGGTLFVAEDGPKIDGGTTSTGTVFKMSLGPGLLQFPLAAAQAPMGGIAVDDTHVYWVDTAVGAIKRCEITGCNMTPATLVTAQNAPTVPVITANAIYWTEYLGGNVRGLAK